MFRRNSNRILVTTYNNNNNNNNNNIYKGIYNHIREKPRFLGCTLLQLFCGSNLRYTLFPTTNVLYYYYYYYYHFFIWRSSPQYARASLFTRFLDHTQWRTIVGRTPLDEWSARLRDLYLTTYNTHDRYPCPPVGFETTISAGERPQTYALGRAVNRTGIITNTTHKRNLWWIPKTMNVRRLIILTWRGIPQTLVFIWLQKCKKIPLEA